MVLGWDDRESASTSISVGELFPSAEAKIINEDGTSEVPEGQRGEFWCRGPNIMKGYWRNPKATENVLTNDGWLITGDIAYVQNGKFFMVDRKKVGRVGDYFLDNGVLIAQQELIKVRGTQVAPAELEALLVEHPLVVDAAVIGAKV